MNVAEVANLIDFAAVLSHLQRNHGIDPDPAFGPLRASHYRFIGECVAAEWNTYDTAREVARRVQESERMYCEFCGDGPCIVCDRGTNPDGSTELALSE